MATGSSTWLTEAFESARKDFLKGLKKSSQYDFQRFGSAADVWDETDRIQKQQAATKTLRALKKIQPFVEGLEEYSRTIEVFVQVKSEILGLIWGPIKFILQISSSLITAFGKVINLLAEFGQTIPQFNSYATLFKENKQIQRVLHLFYVDILDFYQVLLNFLDNRRINTVLELVWPVMRSKVTVIQESIDRHKMLMTSHVTEEDIRQAVQARKSAEQEYEQAQKARDANEFNVILSEIRPRMYDDRLAEILEDSVVDSGEWLSHTPEFTQWITSGYSKSRYFWLKGIPGSGKTFTAANIARHIQEFGKPPLLVFLSHAEPHSGGTNKILQSLVFQAVGGFQTTETLRDTAIKILNGCDTELVILDGLDELEEDRRQPLLRSMNEVLNSCPRLKVLLSSREERDIARQLENRSVGLRVDHHNSPAIGMFAQIECQKWIDDLESSDADESMCNIARECVQRVIGKSSGMILYTKLVLQAMRDQGTSVGIQNELDNLPDGLDAAYSRIIDRIAQKLSASQRSVARKLLQWIMCATRPLRDEELFQILAIEPDATDFIRGRREIQDICKVCGPIIEKRSGYFFFVHFSAKDAAELDAALICSSYLAYTPLNILFKPELGDESAIDDGILAGNFVFFEYASQVWLEHVKRCVSKPLLEDDLQKLSAILSRLFYIRDSETSEDKDGTNLLQGFKSFNGMGMLQMSLASAEKMIGKARHGLLDSESLENYTGPLHIITATRTLRQGITRLVKRCLQQNDQSLLKTIQRLYGSLLFYCSHISCDGYNRGFAAMSERDEHLKLHAQRYKCKEEECVYSEIGFVSAQALAQHIGDHHNPSPSPESTITPEAKDDELLLMLEDAVLCDDINSLRPLGVPKKHLRKLFGTAAWKAGPEIMDYLLQIDKFYNYVKADRVTLEGLLGVAIESQNRPVIAQLLYHGANPFVTVYPELSILEPEMIQKAREGPKNGGFQRSLNGYDRALTLWNPDLMHFLVDDCGVSISSQHGTDVKFCKTPALAGLTSEEVNTRFVGLKKYLTGPNVFHHGVSDALTSRSLQALRICLENQGNPNQPSQWGDPALYNAIWMNTNVGAEMAKLLLQYGANPDSESKQRRIPKSQSKKKWPITALVGIKRFEAYFGGQWEDLVRRIQAGEDVPGNQHRQGNTPRQLRNKKE
ncbi:hypothetical protein F5Y16DRAFT_400366 [Xylariaceae sp. FL0255]|nr:hypothetical protein F5Y16DRAFT_400366 [Xylariaceae sp. FL0255]